MPIIFLAGLFGIMAVGFGAPAEQSSVALFSLVVEALPTWGLALALVLALVMSNMDTLLNGIASAVTSDLPRFWRGARASQLLSSSRLLTILAAVLWSVLTSQLPKAKSYDFQRLQDQVQAIQG